MAPSSASSSERLARISASPAGPRVYLDYAGFAPVDPRVVAMMRPFLEGGIGNPNAQHSLGLEARASLDGARAKVARLFAGTPAGVIFTGSATEANNLAIKGLAQRAAGRHVMEEDVLDDHALPTLNAIGGPALRRPSLIMSSASPRLLPKYPLPVDIVAR